MLLFIRLFRIPKPLKTFFEPLFNAALSGYGHRPFDPRADKIFEPGAWDEEVCKLGKEIVGLAVAKD